MVGARSFDIRNKTALLATAAAGAMRTSRSSSVESAPAEASVPESTVGASNVRRGVIFATVSLALLMSSIDATIVSTALPTLRHALHAPLNWAGWTITAYQFGLVVALPVAGRISDLYGRKRVFLVCVALFTGSSLLCGLAQNIYMLVPLRALQAVGGGAFVPSATGIVADHFGASRDRAIGLFTSIFPIGSMTGPVIGAVMINLWSWRGIFFINVPIGIALFVSTMHFVPKSRPTAAPKPDLVGIAMLAAVILSLMFAITSFGDGHTGLFAPAVDLPLVACVAILSFFVRHVRSVEAPIIPVELFKIPSFAVMNLISVLYGGCALGFGALLPLYAEERYHLTSLQSGTLLSSRAIGAILVAGITAFLLRRIGYRIPMVAGFLAASTGLFLLSRHSPGLSTYSWLAIGAAIMGIGNGIAAPATNNALYSHAPNQASSIAGLRGMFRQFGAIVAISTTTAFVQRSSNEGLALAHTFLIFSVVFVAITPLVLMVPKHKGNW